MWKNIQAVQKLVDAYFETTDKPTLSGLAYFLEVSRQTLYNYSEKDEFLDIIKRARARIEVSYEERLIYGTQPTGVIFALKNMGWTDKLSTDISTDGLPIQVVSYHDIKTK